MFALPYIFIISMTSFGSAINKLKLIIGEARTDPRKTIFDILESRSLRTNKAVIATINKIGGGGSLMLGEPLSTISYLSVFIPHFMGKPTENREILRKLYLDFNLTSLQLSEITGWARTTISDFLRHENIIKDVIKSPNPKFGERTVGGRRIPHQAEVKIIQKILAMKSSGASYREIAKDLTDSGTSTKRGGQWSKTTVQEIYKREQEKQK